jgi:hypothetical protein
MLSLQFPISTRNWIVAGIHLLLLLLLLLLLFRLLLLSLALFFRFFSLFLPYIFFLASFQGIDNWGQLGAFIGGIFISFAMLPRPIKELNASNNSQSLEMQSSAPIHSSQQQPGGINYYNTGSNPFAVGVSNNSPDWFFHHFFVSPIGR